MKSEAWNIDLNRRLHLLKEMTSERVILLRIKEWLFEYSAKFGMTKVLKEIANNHSDLWATKDCTINPAFPLLVVLENVVSTKDVERYPEAIRITELIYEQSRNLLCFRTYLKLQLCLKMMVLFDMLTRDAPSIIQKLNLYFPCTGVVCPNIDSTLARKLSESSKNFRRLFLTLISRPACRRQYMEEEYEQFYGKDFQTKMRGLVEQFICNVHWVMPPTVMERILQKPPNEAFLNQLTSLGSTFLGILFENLENFDILDEPNVLRLVELFQYLSEEPDLPDRPNNDGSIDAYSVALTKGIKPENSHFISQFGLDIEPFHELRVTSTNHDIFNEVEERPEGLTMEGDSTDWGAMEGSPASQLPSWSSLGDIPTDISKGNSDSTNHEQNIAAAPPTEATTSLHGEAEGTSLDLVTIPEMDLPDIQEANSENKSSPVAEPQLNDTNTQVTRAGTTNRPGISRNNDQSKEDNLASLANEEPASKTKRFDEPKVEEGPETNCRKPAVRVYRRETRPCMKKLDSNVGALSNKKRGRDASLSPTNSKRPRNNSPPADEKRGDDVGNIPTNERRNEEDDETSDLSNDIFGVIDNGRLIKRSSQEDANNKSGQSDSRASEGESILVIAPLDEPSQQNPPTSVSKEFDSSFEKCIPDNLSKFDAVPQVGGAVRQEEEHFVGAKDVKELTEDPDFQSSPEEHPSRGFAVPLVPSASRKRPAEDSSSDSERQGKRRKVESPLPSQVTSSWDSSCSSSTNECAVEPSDNEEILEVEDFDGSISDYFEGIHRSNEEMRLSDELPEGSRCPLTFMTKQVGFELADSELAIQNAPDAGAGDNCSQDKKDRSIEANKGQESANQIPSTQFYSPASSPSAGGLPSQPTSSSGTFYSCHGLSQESRKIETIELTDDEDSESDINITMTEVTPKLNKKIVVLPARERPLRSESPGSVQVGQKLTRDAIHEVVSDGRMVSSEAVRNQTSGVTFDSN